MGTHLRRIEPATTAAPAATATASERAAVVVGVAGLLADVTYVLAIAVPLATSRPPPSPASSAR